MMFLKTICSWDFLKKIDGTSVNTADVPSFFIGIAFILYKYKTLY